MEVHARPVLSENFNDTAEFKVFWIVLGKLRHAVGGVLGSAVRANATSVSIIRIRQRAIVLGPDVCSAQSLKASCVPNE